MSKQAKDMQIGELIRCPKDEVEIKRKSENSWFCYSFESTITLDEVDAQWYLTRSHGSPPPLRVESGLSYKQLHGRCEDAPCCGCCGQPDWS